MGWGYLHAGHYKKAQELGKRMIEIEPAFYTGHTILGNSLMIQKKCKEAQAPLEMAAKTWTGEWWKYGGGSTCWDAMAYDPDLNLFYVGTGNDSPWSRHHRSRGGGDNLFLSSIVAVNPDNGEYVWHYQTTPGEK